MLMEGDEDGDGVLTTKEFKNYILRNVVDDESLLSGADLDHLLKLLDLDSDGIIDPEEFIAFAVATALRNRPKVSGLGSYKMRLAGK